MNYKMITYLLGRIFLIEAALLLLPLGTAVIYGEVSTIPAFLFTIVVLVGLGVVMGLRAPQDTVIFARDGLVIVGLMWVLMSLFGALPFWFSGEIPHLVDAFFETVSGFTTTGSSILTDVEAMSRGLLMWRSFTHWVGGVGVLVFAMAVLPMGDGRGMHLMRAEVPGVTVGKMSSKLRDSARINYGIYLTLTVLEIILLLAGGMPLYDTLIHTFGTAGTGGFSHLAASVGGYNNPYYEVVIGIFMLLFGVNFNIYYLLLLRRFKEALSSEEVRVYFGIVTAAVVAIAINITRMYGSALQALRHAFFQVASIITTTGFATQDFDLWPNFSKTVLVLLMFIGACAGSTGGGLKTVRIILMVKASARDLQKASHPRAVTSVRFEGKALDTKTLNSVHVYITIYLLLFTASVLLLSLEHFDLVTTFTAVAACLNNIGPGLSVVGPTGNFSAFSVAGKLLLSFDMLAGRLELFPMLALFTPSVWVHKRRSH